MELSLQPKERTMLLAILTNYLSDLRMEITDTEKFALREELKADEAMVKDIIARLEQSESFGA